MTATIHNLKAGKAEIARSREFAKLVIEMAEIREMLAVINTPEFKKVKTWCEKEEYISPVYDAALNERYDVIQHKLLELKNSKGE
jgi:hypothetical protein